MAQMHPLRLQFSAYSDANPFAFPLRVVAEMSAGTASGPGNAFVEAQEKFSEAMVEGLETWRKTAEYVSEQLFLKIYGSPWPPKAMGIDPDSDKPLRKAEKNPLHRQLQETRVGQLRDGIPDGGSREAVVRESCCMPEWRAAMLTSGVSRCCAASRRPHRSVVRRVQADGARPVLHAADRDERSACGPAGDDAGRGKGPGGGLCDDREGAGFRRRNRRRCRRSAGAGSRTVRRKGTTKPQAGVTALEARRKHAS